MATINGIFEQKSIEPKTLLLGDNEFETGVLNVPTPGEGETVNIPNGTVLTRAESGKYVAAEDTDGPLFVLFDNVITPITAAGDYPVRVCISGSLNRNLVFLAGEPVTDAQVDALRQNNILALTVHEIQ